MGFKKWFEWYGVSLLEGWLRAREDGNEEEFHDWILGEYGYYREMPHEELEDDDDYAVPYHGLLDRRSKAEEYLGLHHRIEEVQ
jgi:hypothetical protein